MGKYRAVTRTYRELTLVFLLFRALQRGALFGNCILVNFSAFSGTQAGSFPRAVYADI